MSLIYILIIAFQEIIIPGGVETVSEYMLSAGFGVEARYMEFELTPLAGHTDSMQVSDVKIWICPESGMADGIWLYKL